MKKDDSSISIIRPDSEPEDYEDIDISAGGVVLKKDENKLKIALQTIPDKRRDPQWCLPKGRIEKEDRLLNTAKREVAEEAGILEKNLELKQYIGKVQRPSRTYNVWKKIHYFLFFTNQKN